MTRGIVFGCFDLFHIGHHIIISRCLNLCDNLTIGLFTDGSIKKYKGHEPAVPYKYRAELLRAIFPNVKVEATRRRIQNLDDYEIVFCSETLRGRKKSVIPDNHKGDIIYLPYTKYISSSKIRKRCLRIW
jgi:cytidyltransferase-like protein